MNVESTDVLVIGSGFGGAIPAFHLAAGGAKVVVMERGERLGTQDFEHSMRLDGMGRVVQVAIGQGITALVGNCVGGGSVPYFGVSLRAPSFAFERRGSVGRRIWPAELTRTALDPWYDRAERALPVTTLTWDQVSYAGGLWAAACAHSGRTCDPVPVAVDTGRCTDCAQMLFGCHFGAKRSMILNYLPAAEAHGATIRPSHEVQQIRRSAAAGYRYRVDYNIVDPAHPERPADEGSIDAKVVVLAAGAMASPVLLMRSAVGFGGMPAAVGRFLSGNGDMLTNHAMDERRIKETLRLDRGDGVAFEAYMRGKAITTMYMDRLDPKLPEFERFSIQQAYLPPFAAVLAEVPNAQPSWYGSHKREVLRGWRSWLGTLSMTEDDNEGYFGSAPPFGSYAHVAPGITLTPAVYKQNEYTKRGVDLLFQEMRAIIENPGLGQVLRWDESVGGRVTAHPLSSVRMGDDPALSALDSTHELRGHPGIFVTDGSAVPAALCVNPSLTIAALAERAVPGIVARAASFGVPVKYAATLPGS